METIQQTQMISIDKEVYLNILNRLEKVEKEVFSNEFEEFSKANIETLKEIWNNKEDDERFKDL